MAQSSLIEAFEIRRGDVVALVGGGGKTTTMLSLGAEAVARGWSATLGTTTKVGLEQVLAPADFIHGGIVAGKFTGAPPEAFVPCRDGIVVIEADGARGRPAKAPADHEPVIPASATLVIAVIGADALGRVIADQCLRPLRVAAVVGCQPYERLTPIRAANLLLSTRGGRKNVPVEARFAVLITKVAQTNSELVVALGECMPSVQIVRVGAIEKIQPHVKG